MNFERRNSLCYNSILFTYELIPVPSNGIVRPRKEYFWHDIWFGSADRLFVTEQVAVIASSIFDMSTLYMNIHRRVCNDMINKNWNYASLKKAQSFVENVIPSELIYKREISLSLRGHLSK